jgi:gliding motility-associated-like protein
MTYGLFDAPPLNVNPLTNANFLGVVSSDPPTKGAAPQGAGLVNTTGGNTVYYLAPVYLFDASNDSSANNLIVALDLDGDGTADCFHVNSAASVQIVFLDSITVNTPVIACNTANGSFDVTVSASGGKPAFDGSSFTFQIGNQSGQAANNATYTFTNVASTTGEFTLTVFDEAGCPKAFTYPLSQIIGNATVTSNYNGYNVSCYGFNDGTATANAIGSGNYNYAWSDGSTSQSVSGLYGNRTYTVTITDANDPDVCPFISSVSLTQPDSAYLYISPSDTSIYTGKQVQLNSVFGPLASSTIVSYTWTPSTGLSCSDCPNPVFDGTVDTNLYVLNVVYLNGCEISTSAVVYVIDDRLLYALPTAFSPNGDGKNDVFKVILNKEVSSFAMRIYNRWGEKIFESTDAKLGWDGRYKGAMQPTEVYVCYFTITKFDGEVIHQETSFSLLR